MPRRWERRGEAQDFTPPARLSTITPAMTSPSPANFAALADSPRKTMPMMAIAEVPTADQAARGGEKVAVVGDVVGPVAAWYPDAGTMLGAAAPGGGSVSGGPARSVHKGGQCAS